MDSKLNNEEICALQSLDPDTTGGPNFREGDFPQRLFAFNLVSRQPSGVTILTKHGERTLFRQACLSSLAALEGGEPVALASGVQKWLLSSGFVEGARADPDTLAITPRGKLWLASFKDDSGALAPTLDAFARRRA